MTRSLSSAEPSHSSSSSCALLSARVIHVSIQTKQMTSPSSPSSPSYHCYHSSIIYHESFLYLALEVVGHHGLALLFGHCGFPRRRARPTALELRHYFGLFVPPQAVSNLRCRPCERAAACTEYVDTVHTRKKVKTNTVFGKRIPRSRKKARV